jgi:hypothetical protein
VATLLAYRNDEDQTYRWLWSAAELGLGDVIDYDHAYFLTTLCHVASQRKWPNVLKVASKLAVKQWKALQFSDQVREVEALATE